MARANRGSPASPHLEQWLADGPRGSGHQRRQRCGAVTKGQLLSASLLPVPGEGSCQFEPQSCLWRSGECSRSISWTNLESESCTPRACQRRRSARPAATLLTAPLCSREEDSQWKEEQKLEAHSDWVRDVAWAPSIGLPTSTIASCSQVRQPGSAPAAGDSLPLTSGRGFVGAALP